LNPRILSLAAGTLLIATACGRDAVFVEMSDSTFVRTMIALRKLPVGAIDSAGRMRQRDSVLRTFGVTAAAVESTAVRLAGDPARAAVVWRAIENASTSSPP
jgi:hypothetical protein